MLLNGIAHVATELPAKVSLFHVSWLLAAAARPFRWR
jgi:hypothetical protein